MLIHHPVLYLFHFLQVRLSRDTAFSGYISSLVFILAVLKKEMLECKKVKGKVFPVLK